MKGYSPKFESNIQKEINSQSQYSFIELGVQSKCDEDCECETCTYKQK